MRRLRHLDPGERRRLWGLTGAVAALHLFGWGLFLLYLHRYPALAGLGTLAYTFGLRHAFDADHIAAIDNTTRKLLADGRRPLGVGFFFSLGHATIVFALTIGLAVASRAVGAGIPVLESYGGAIGTGVSGVFLWVIGILNLLVLLDIVRVFGALRRSRLDDERLERRLQERGLIGRFVPGRVFRLVSRSWHMYPVGLLFGLGFDTATEVGLLVLAAGVASHAVPFLAVLSLPLLFTAGMSLMDTADGAFMSRAYGWALSSPVRRIYYSLTVTTLSVVVALAVGSVELLQVAAAKLGLSSGPWGTLARLDLGRLGYVLAATFALAWIVSALVWKAARIERRFAPERG